MAGRNPTAAVKAFVAPIKDALGLFASGKVTADSYKPDVGGVLTFNDGEVVKLRGGNKVGLSVSMRYSIIEADEAVRVPLAPNLYIARGAPAPALLGGRQGPYTDRPRHD